MPDSNCRSCGSNLEIITVCKLCNQPLVFACNRCGSFLDEKVHLNCRRSDIEVTRNNQAQNKKSGQKQRIRIQMHFPI